MRRMKDRRKKGVKRRNPMARALRTATFRARAQANRKRYTRKLKHRQRRKVEPTDES